MIKHNLPMWASLLLAMLAIIGWSLHWHLTINNSNVSSPTIKQSGYLSVAQCSAIRVGLDETDIVAKYGMPHNDTSDNGDSDLLLAYPTEEDHQKDCTIFFSLEKHTVYDVALDLIEQGDTFS